MAKRCKTKSKKRKLRKNAISVLEIVDIEAAARRQAWIDAGCPRFKTGTSVDRKKARNKKACRGRVEA